MDDWNGSGWLGAATKVARGLGALGFIARDGKGHVPANHSRFLGTASLSLLLICCLILFCAGSAWSQQANLALNKPVTFHTDGGCSTALGDVVDGDSNTVCYSFQGGSYTEISFTIDLAFAVSLERYRFLPRQLTTYRIETSMDNLEWIERLSGVIAYSETNALVIDNPTPHRARYIRFTGSNDQTAFAGLADFEAFGSVIGAIELPRTGQSRCYDVAGVEINCAGTGQDGEIQAGVAWPEPRFTDNGDGTLTDNLTGLIWLKNANCYGRVTWDDALSNADSLADGVCGLSDSSLFGDWRLPNVIELESLVHFDYHRQLADPNIYTTNARWLNSQGFTTTQNSGYWTSTTAPNHADRAYYVYMDFGYTHFDEKNETAYFMAVRGSSDGPAALWRTGQTIDRADGDDGDLQKGVPWPSPRFVDNNDGTVTDQLTGLIWLKNANCAGSPRGWDAALSDVAQLNAAGTMNSQACGDTSNGGSHQSDWRLPNIKELRSLNDFSAYNPTVAAGHPFTNLLTDHYHLSASHASRDTAFAWVVAMVDGYTNRMPKDEGFGTYYVWPVRGGMLSAEGPHPFAGGDGSADDPYQIATAEQLDAVRDYLDKHFVLTADIDLTDEWEPIGTYVDWENPANQPFTGSLNGAGFAINGLFIDQPNRQDVGLFGLTADATIENLNLVDVDITGRTAGGLIGWAFKTIVRNVATSGEVKALTRAGGLMGEVFEDSFVADSSSSCTVSTTNGTNAGGLIGQMRGTTLIRSHATGNVSTGTQDLAGGLVGEATSGSFIDMCYAAGNVSGTSEIGGLVGYLRDSRIEKSHATGRVDGGTTDRIGGLVGHLFSNARVENSYAGGEVIGGSKVGGLVGEIDETSSVINSYAVGRVIGTSNVGGLVGHASGATISNSYYDRDAGGQSDTGKGEPKTTAELQQLGTFSGTWNIVGDTNIDQGYPFLAWQGQINYFGNPAWVIGMKVDTYTVTATAGAGGSISPATQTVISGSTAQFTVTPNTGFSIASVSGCGGTLDGNTYTTAAVTGDCSVTAGFAQLPPPPAPIEIEPGFEETPGVEASHRLTRRDSQSGEILSVTSAHSAMPNSTTVVQEDSDNPANSLVLTSATLDMEGVSLTIQVEAHGDGSAIHRVILSGEGIPDEIISEARIALPGAFTLIAEDGLVTSWIELPQRDGRRWRAVVQTNPQGESRSWYESYNEDSENWQPEAYTLADEEQAFEPGNRIEVSENEEFGEVEIRVETTLTQPLHF